ncbi:MAG: beta-ketoacyl synthase N-terminal-like domain-containing protein, partial [Vicinamibacterales bacterium]
MRADAERVAVIAAGACTPLGISIDEAWEALRAGRTGVSVVEHLIPARSGCKVAALASAGDAAPHMRIAKHAKYAGRSAVHALHALRDALGQQTVHELAACRPDRIALYTATGQTGLDEEEFYPALSAAWAGQVDCDYGRVGGRAARLVDPHFSLRTLSNGPLA